MCTPPFRTRISRLPLPRAFQICKAQNLQMPVRIDMLKRCREILHRPLQLKDVDFLRWAGIGSRWVLQATRAGALSRFQLHIPTRTSADWSHRSILHHISKPPTCHRGTTIACTAAISCCISGMAAMYGNVSQSLQQQLLNLSLEASVQLSHFIRSICGRALIQ